MMNAIVRRFTKSPASGLSASALSASALSAAVSSVTHGVAVVVAVCILGAHAFAQGAPDGASNGEEPAAQREAEPASELSDDEARARELFQNGAILYEEGQYEQSIVAWEEAYRLSEAPLLLFNIANALERLNRLEACIEMLDLYRAYAPADERERLERRIRTLQERLDQENAAAAAQAQSTEEAGPGVSRDVVRGPTPRGVVIARYSLLGLSAAGFGTGIAMGLAANSQGDQAAESCTGTPALCSQDASNALDAQRRNALLSDIGFGVGAVALIGGVTLFLVRGPIEQEQRATSIDPVFTRDGGGFVVRTRF